MMVENNSQPSFERIRQIKINQRAATEPHKHDRFLRLLDILMVLGNYHEKGVSVSEMAERYGVSFKTIYRDLEDLQKQHKFPIVDINHRYRMLDGELLPPVRFSLTEAMVIFLSARLLVGHSNAYIPGIGSTFNKLNVVLKGPLKDYLRKTVEAMKLKREDATLAFVLEALTTAWTRGKRVKICYVSLGQRSAEERVVEPYYIQPAAVEHANYLIARCLKTGEIRIFKLERITDIQILDEEYSVPESFNVDSYLGSSFGITVDTRVETVKLKFTPELARIAQETRWHPTQVSQMELDGSCLVTMKVSITVQLVSFILGWAKQVKVLAPERLKKMVLKAAGDISSLYTQFRESEH